MILDEIEFFGHKNLLATHKTTLEITKDNFLTKRGDCIIGIKSNKGAKDLSDFTKSFLRSENKVIIRIIVDDIEERFFAYGSKYLTFLSENSIVIRKSSFVDDRTIAIFSEKAAKDINRLIVEKLISGYKGKLILEGR